jgi:hypothetical protein
VSAAVDGVPQGMTESPVDPAHDDHGENPDGTHDQDADPPTPMGQEPEPAESGVEHPDPEPGTDGTGS